MAISGLNLLECPFCDQGVSLDYSQRSMTRILHCTSYILTCSEPRDIVYAFMGIASHHQDLNVSPDYTKPLIEILADVLILLKSQNISNRPGPKPSRVHLRILAFRLGLMDPSAHYRNLRTGSCGTILPTLSMAYASTRVASGHVGLTQHLARTGRLHMPWVAGLLPGFIYLMHATAKHPNTEITDDYI
jgi:hypothetical protein